METTDFDRMLHNIIPISEVRQKLKDILAALPHLTATQVYDALSYYHDHQAEIDGLIQESRPERVIAAQGLRVEKVAEGVAVVHDKMGRW